MKDQGRQITDRILKYADLAISNGQIASVSELAKAAGMSDQQVYMIRRDATRNFTLEQLSRLANRYNLDMNYFFSGAGSPQLAPKVEATTTDILRYLIVKLEEEKHGKGAVNIAYNTKAKKG